MPTKAKPGMPYADGSIAKFIDRQIHKLKGVKTQRQIAAEIGYDRPNVISMFKRGEMKVPLEKIPALARAVEADPAHLFQLALEQYWPGLEETIRAIFGRTVTANEEEILIKPWRKLTEHRDPAPSHELDEAVERLFDRLTGASDGKAGGEESK